MNKSKLPAFESLADLVDFFDTHDMEEYDLPEVGFEVNVKKRTYLVTVQAC